MLLVNAIQVERQDGGQDSGVTTSEVGKVRRNAKSSHPLPDEGRALLQGDVEQKYRKLLVNNVGHCGFAVAFFVASAPKVPLLHVLTAGDRVELQEPVGLP